MWTTPAPTAPARPWEAAVASGKLAPGPRQTVRVIRKETNVGFGAGHNTVLPELASDYHFILNPDILLREDTLSDWPNGCRPTRRR